MSSGIPSVWIAVFKHTRAVMRFFSFQNKLQYTFGRKFSVFGYFCPNTDINQSELANESRYFIKKNTAQNHSATLFGKLEAFPKRNYYKFYLNLVTIRKSIKIKYDNKIIKYSIYLFLKEIIGCDRLLAIGCVLYLGINRKL